MTTALPGFNLANPSENIQYRALIGSTRPRPIIFLSPNKKTNPPAASSPTPSKKTISNIIRMKKILTYKWQELKCKKDNYKIKEYTKKRIKESRQMSGSNLEINL